MLDFYNERRKDVAKALPNAAHIGLAALEKYFDVYIITQNIDDLHERGGSKNVLHLHGEIFKSRSVNNSLITYTCKGDINLGDLAPDGSQLRPFIVWFEEPVPMMDEAVKIVQDADIFVVIGTSLQVYPAAGLLYYVNPYAAKYIIDKHIPTTENLGQITAIEASATEGILVLQEMLRG